MHTKLVIGIEKIYERGAENVAIERGRYKIRKALVCNTEFEFYHESIQKTPENSC